MVQGRHGSTRRWSTSDGVHTLNFNSQADSHQGPNPSLTPDDGTGEARFDEEVVGPDGAGYRWDVRDAAHRQYSIAAPPPEDPEEEDDADSDDDRSITTAAELVCFPDPDLKSDADETQPYRQSSSLYFQPFLFTIVPRWNSPLLGLQEHIVPLRS